MIAFMYSFLSRQLRGLGVLIATLILGGSLFSQTPPPAAPIPYDDDAAPLILARKYLEGGEGSRAALLEALERMGWGVRNAKGDVVKAAPAKANTGLAMRDYELEELLWNPSEQPAVRLIAVAQAIAVPFEDADPEELAQDIVETIRKGAESEQPQQRFWARFIIALGRVSPANYDLGVPAQAAVMQPSKAQLKEIEAAVKKNPFAMMQAGMIQAMQPTPVWPDDDPVLAPSPKPKRAEGDNRAGSTERDQKRMSELSAEMGKLSAEMGSSDPAKQKAAQDKFAKISMEMSAISQRMTAANMQQMGAAMKRMQKAKDGDEDESESDDDSGPRFTAEHRDQPLSLLQIALITRVLVADIRLAASQGKAGHASFTPARWMPVLPVAAIGVQVAQAGGGVPSFGSQVSGAFGDIWATGWGAYTGAVLDHHLPDSKFSKGASIANTIMAWFKTIMSVARQKITIEVENAPLVRTKTRSAGEQRTAKATVIIDFPKSDVFKAIRAAGNLATLDLQVPDGGPVGGAKVVWRLPEGSYNGKYENGKGGWEYRPDLAVVQFAQGEGYVSMTNDDGVATIKIEGTPQKKDLPKTVRPYPRRAAIAVEVTIKVGNITQDFNDAINTAMGGVVSGGLSFIADMMLRTSFLFQAGKSFEVTDWKVPAWEGKFEIYVKASGSKHEKGEKGGPDQDYTWSMNRYMHGMLYTPEYEEEEEQKKDYEGYGRHRLVVDGGDRGFRLEDSSSSKSKNSDNRYEAHGPLQIRPPARNQLEVISHAEPSGDATLTLTGGKAMLDLNVFFGAECLVIRSESGRGKTRNSSGPQYLSLLNGVHPDTFTAVTDAPEDADYVEGTWEVDALGNLPYVPSFDAKVTLKYQLWKNGPPPKNKKR